MQKKWLAPVLIVIGLFLTLQSIVLVMTLFKMNDLEKALPALAQQAQQAAVPEDEANVDKPGAQTAPTPVETEGFPERGPADAPVTIVEFTDFECTFCKAVQPTIQQVVEKYDGQIRHVFRNYPIGAIHAGAVDAALAGLCANDQQQFWDYHDQLFAKANDSGSLTKPLLKQTAADLGLNTADFNACFDSKKHLDAIQKDFEAGNAYTVTGTPTFFINNRIVTGAQPLEVFTEIIEEELAKAKKS
ncbi:protein-disulfide isomerase [Tumebacillus sp. BK434]|uniref:DsbA family protein n=1 Tax=Tumebacillus sp. BK434 TaxID=2512169 RepID=UPI001048A5E9|nr:thioredoxin domain-containing protein [Tumebacillus sp. BK434]TCP55842.1 protein-disulfide isomerase [Tumebacillus sp. BK434]